ncbi:hypothetical protein AXX17_AT3G31090 [Arabidopsis thaliana]|uniref:Uncharacterized protein n=1 Tax=Arabidopsis thaliana TaxID=3702 RepID=A0A178VCW8_ARATH|nr:hypothetical protein AXX17_AT3G31090 [Arabidopsis thaliana]
MLETGAIWGITGTTVTSFMFFWAIYKQYVPAHFRAYVERYFHKMIGWISYYVDIKFTEYTDEGQRNEKQQIFGFSMDDHEEIEDEFEGVKVKWYSNVKVIQPQSNYGQRSSEERRHFTLSFHRRHRGKWSNVPFHHPATFETLAMDPEKKEGIKKDLIKFSKGKDYYKKVGKPWKRAKEKKEEDEEEDGEEKKEGEKKPKVDDKQSKVTLSGLLNSIDGLWSACSGEKIIVFTTNFVDKLDPALIRRGRMDNHIEMSYCKFEAFKVLAKNYLEIETHDLYLHQAFGQDFGGKKEKARKLAEEEEKKKAEKEAKKIKKAEEAEEKKKKTEEDEKKENVKGKEENGNVSQQNGNSIDLSKKSDS